MPCSTSTSNCCNALLNLYVQLYQLFLDCPPSSQISETTIDLAFLLSWLALVITPIFNKTKCSQVFCCDGLVASIYAAFQVAMSALTTANDATFQAILDNLAATLNGILTQAGFPTVGFPNPISP